jgi:mRNA-degrading endonuclease toxin of MazEF toxin-antitoxin module
VTRGEVWWYELPDEGARPGCILTRTSAIPVLNALLVAPALRTVRDIATQVHLDADDGMPYPCALSLDNTLTAPKSMLVERVTVLGSAKLAELCAALGAATDC